MDPDILCPLCGGRLAVLAGPTRLTFFCEASREQVVNHGDLVADPSLPWRERLRPSLEGLLRTWEQDAAALATTGARALGIGRPEVGDTFGREAETAAKGTLLLRSFLATQGAKLTGVPRQAAAPLPAVARPFAIGALEARAGVGLVRVAGAVDYSNVSALGGAIEAFFKKGFFRILVDLSSATSLASCALSLLLSALDRSIQGSGSLILVGTPPRIRQVLAVMGLDDILPFADTVTAALDALEATEASSS